MAKIANIVKKFMFRIFFLVLLEELLVEVVDGCDEKNSNCVLFICSENTEFLYITALERNYSE